MKRLRVLIAVLLTGTIVMGVAVAQTLSGTDVPPANPIYVALLALTPIMLFIIGWFMRRELSRTEAAQSALAKQQEKDRKEAETDRKDILAQIEKQRQESEKDREEIYRNMRADREQMTKAVDKVADALTAVDKRLVAIETAAQIRSSTPIPKL